jgi:glutathione S-transferase
MEDFFTAKPFQRTEEEQRAVDEEAKKLSLYHFPSCPYCLQVRSVLQRLKLNIELKDIHQFPDYGEELVRHGGRSTVPCLRIQEEDGKVRWLYESPDINRFLEEKFGPRRE